MDDRTETVEPEHGRCDGSAVVRMRLVHPREIASTCTVESATLTIGRNPSSRDSLAIPHPAVSREHAFLDSSTGWTICDRGSHNGTFVDGVRAEPQQKVALASGSVVRLGDVLLVFELERELPRDTTSISLDELPGESSAMRRIRAAVESVASFRSPVLITGETGTGKERVAREIHRTSGRRGPFIAVNCAELTKELFASTLFGWSRGAYTGAEQEGLGVIRSAEGGTLFLDEITEVDVGAQAALLRVVEEGEVRAVGGAAAKVDVRFLAATNCDLLAQVETGGFRRDLYARLALNEVVVPPLRARRMDLIDWFAKLSSTLERELAVPLAVKLHALAAEALLLHEWPYNLRELARLLRRLAAEGRETVVRADVEESLGKLRDESTISDRSGTPSAEQLQLLLDELGSVRAVAKALGRDRRQVYRWIEKYNLRR